MLLGQDISDIVRQAEAAYAIRVTAAEQAGYGSGNRNYILITEQGAYVLCLIEEQTVEEVNVMSRTLKWLADYGYLSTKVQQTACQKLTAIIDGKPALLRDFLRGDVCWSPNDGQVHQIGVSLAALHQLPCPEFLPTDIYYTQGRFIQALTSGHDPQYEAWVKMSLMRIDIKSFTDLPKGLIHADVFTDNILFDGDELVAIIDFELACNYILAFDLALAIVGTCLRDGKPCLGKINSLIAGYETIRPLSVREINAIKPLTEYAAIMTSLWRYWRYRCHEPEHIKRHAYRELTAVASRISDVDFLSFMRSKNHHF